MAGGRPAGIIVEIEFTAGVWTSASAYLVDETVVSGGRPTAYEDTAPGTLSLQLRNSDGRFTPDNPTSPYWPNVKENVGIRCWVNGPTFFDTRLLFNGHIDSWEPTYPTSHISSAVVTVQASDMLARVNRLTLHSAWVEKCLERNTLDGGVWTAVWPCSGESHAERLMNIGDGLDARLNRRANPPRGSYSLGESVDDMLLDGALALTPGDVDASADRRGWTVTYRPGELDGMTPGFTVGMWHFWVQIPPDMPLKTSDGVAWTHMTVGSVNGAHGVVMARMDLSADGGTLNVYDADNVLVGSPAVPAGDPISLRDGAWHLISASPSELNPGSSWWCIDDSAVGATLLDVDIRGSESLILGGWKGDSGASAARWCVPMLVGPVAALDFFADDFVSDIPYGLGDPTATVAAHERATSIQEYIYAHGIYTSGADVDYDTGEPQVGYTNTAGLTCGEVAQTLARTVGGAFWVQADGTPKYADGATLRGPDVAITITLELDDDGSTFTWRRAVDERPTRVTATSPAGTVTVIDTDAEALGARRDESIETAAGTIAAADAAASWRMSLPAGLRLCQIGVDIVTASTDLWDLLDLLIPFTRIRVSGLPSSQFGVTYADVFLVGWTVTLSSDSVHVLMDTVPAGTEVEVGTGRVGGTCTLNTTVTSSSTTIIVTTLTGQTWSTNAALYPCDVNLGGERVTFNTAPSGSSSPQTFTGVTRGVAPSVAAAHTAGVSIDAWDVLTVII
jgi:hypothetical protein